MGSITKETGESVWGVVFTITSPDLKRLDRYEGVESGAYKREQIEVLDEHGKRFDVWTYIAVPEQGGPFLPHKDYIDLYVRGAKHFGLPLAYVQSLERIRDNAKTS